MPTDLLSKLKTFSVLYVEDESGIRNNIQEILKYYFKEVFIARNASEAHIKYVQNKPDLIITDIKMPPGETGVDLVKKIRQSDSKTRIIITSAHTDLEYMLEVAELHLVKYIVKPITHDKLTQALESFIKSFNSDVIYHIDETWTFDATKSIISDGKNNIDLTKKESTFLKILITKKRIITYEEIEHQIWDDESVMTPNAMRLFIKNFRKKLPDNSLKNIQGTGYRLVISS